jgi:hypothetical protein
MWATFGGPAEPLDVAEMLVASRPPNVDVPGRATERRQQIDALDLARRTVVLDDALGIELVVLDWILHVLLSFVLAPHACAPVSTVAVPSCLVIVLVLRTGRCPPQQVTDTALREPTPAQAKRGTSRRTSR